MTVQAPRTLARLATLVVAVLACIALGATPALARGGSGSGLRFRFRFRFRQHR